MKTFSYLIGFITVSLFVFSGCQDQILNKQPRDQVPEDNVWEDESLTEAYLNDIYLGMGNGFYEIMLSSHTDESHFIHGYGTEQVVQSIISPSDLGSWEDGDGRNAYYQWQNLYSRIRDANIFLDNIDDASIEDEELRDRMRGEAHFLRAYLYHWLLKLWGGVPIVDEVFELDSDFNVERNTYEETVDFIVDDAETAADLLPLEHEDVGRATEGAALALKSRVLLYAASDLYHNTDWTSGYDNPELIGYQGANRQEMWREAKEAAEDVMDLGMYELHGADPAAEDSTAQNYAEVFLSDDHNEAILSHYFLQERSYEGWEADPGLHNGPNGYHNWGGNTPTHQIASAYEMDDGSEFDMENNPEHAENPYEDRDPRFYASILYDGAEWRERPDDVIDDDPEGIVQTAVEYVTFDDNGDTVDVSEGLDTRDSPIEDWNGSYTGYYLRKFIAEDVDHQYNRQEVPWHYFRYAEILLNYAEASIELGEEDDARNAINQIRRRAGMPEITDTGDELLERYRNERRVELAFEEHRYFDIRRWMTAPDEVDENAQGIELHAERNEDDPYYDYDYTDVEIIDVQDRGWNDRAYFLPINRDEMDRNEELIQNPNYGD